MTRQELEHIISASCNLLGVDSVMILGSQSILASYPNVSGIITKSDEADVAMIPVGDDPVLLMAIQEEAAWKINGSLGEGSTFHKQFGFYAEGVTMDVAIIPDGWERRLVNITNENTNYKTGKCLAPDDMAFSKLVAGREKDFVVLGNLMRQGILKAVRLRGMVEKFEEDGLPHGITSAVLLSRIDRLEREAMLENQ